MTASQDSPSPAHHTQALSKSEKNDSDYAFWEEVVSRGEKVLIDYCDRCGRFILWNGIFEIRF
jgi:hypothetical protein